MKYLYLPIMLIANGICWLWCKATGKRFEGWGGPQ